MVRGLLKHFPELRGGNCDQLPRPLEASTPLARGICARRRGRDAPALTPVLGVALVILLIGLFAFFSVLLRF